LRFFLLTFAISWALFIPVAAFSGPSITPLDYALLLLGTIAPSLVALWLTGRARGESARRELLERALNGRVPAGWFVFSGVFTLAIKLAAALILRLATGGWPRFGTTSVLLMFAATAISTPVQAGEEIGWRGYALPRLAARLGVGRASVVLGLVWACWHFPLFYLRGADTFGQSFVVYALQVMALSVVIAWLYARTGSLLVVMVFHAAVNNTKDVVPSALTGGSGTFALSASPVGWVTLSLLWVVAICCLAGMPKRVPGFEPSGGDGGTSGAGP